MSGYFTSTSAAFAIDSLAAGLISVLSTWHQDARGESDVKLVSLAGDGGFGELPLHLRRLPVMSFPTAPPPAAPTTPPMRAPVPRCPLPAINAPPPAPTAAPARAPIAVRLYSVVPSGSSHTRPTAQNPRERRPGDFYAPPHILFHVDNMFLRMETTRLVRRGNFNNLIVYHKSGRGGDVPTVRPSAKLSGSASL